MSRTVIYQTTRNGQFVQSDSIPSMGLWGLLGMFGYKETANSLGEAQEKVKMYQENKLF